MTKPESFTITSDYAPLKNDGEAVFTLVLPASLFIAASATYSLSDTATIGTAGASERSQISSSKTGRRYVGSIISIERSGTSGGGPASYNILATLTRSSATTLTAAVEIRNPYIGPLTTASGSETFTFYVSTFIPPFA